MYCLYSFCRWLRKKAKQKDPTLVADLEKLVEPTTQGDPESCLRWTCKSVRKLAKLEGMGHQVSYPVVAELLHELNTACRQKKELIGNFKNGGQEWRRQFEHINAKVQQYIDFKQPELGRAAPYRVYDLVQNTGWVSVGVDHDTASFAVETIRRWWHAMGTEKYPQAKRLLITADGGGSNGSRLRLWKLELQTLLRIAAP